MREVAERQELGVETFEIGDSAIDAPMSRAIVEDRVEIARSIVADDQFGQAPVSP